MKKTQRIELCHNIRHTLVSFIAIVIFVALATGLYTGISWTGNALDLSIERQYSNEAFHNFTLSYPYGFSDGFIGSLLSDGTVDAAEGCYETYRTLEYNGSKYQIKLSSLTETVDRPTCAEGVMPAKAGEAAVNIHWAQKNGVSVGDELRFEPGDGRTGAMLGAVLSGSPEALLALPESQSDLVTDTFRVTALVEAGEYMCRFSDANGFAPDSPEPVAAVVFADESAFDPAAFCGYPKAVVRADELAGLLTSSEEYRTASEELKATLEERAADFAEKKNADIRRSADVMSQSLRMLPAEGLEQQRTEALCAALENIGEYGTFVSSRQMNVSFAGVRSVMDTFEKMQYSLVSLFVIIGILVCYSTISRLVFDQMIPIGTKKALGFFPKEIILPFLVYSAAAVGTGSLLGVLIGRFLIEPVMVSSVRTTYRFNTAVYYLGAKQALLFALLQFVLLILTALIASANVSKQKALKLLSGEQLISDAEHRWLEKLPFWERTSLLRKTIVKNCLNDRRRVFATLVGIMGCTALVVCALTMYNNLEGSLDRSMEKITTLDTILYFGGGKAEEAALSERLDETGAEYAGLLYIPGATKMDDGKQVVTGLYAVDNERFYELFHLYDMADGEEKHVRDGAWVNIAYAENNNASVGDTLCFTDASGQSHDLVIEGIYDYYLMNYRIVIPKELYESEFGRDYEPNTFFLNTDGTDPDALKQSLLAEDGDLVFSDFRGNSRNLFESILGIARAVSAVYLVLSAILAALLLLNLFIMFVNEKKKELITLMINGFSRKDAERYIYADARLLTVIGIAGGLVVGSIMGKFSLDSFNNVSTHFLNRVDIAACVIGVIFAAFLTYIMCRIALRRVKKFSLADINSL